jgi:hypothetical protein
VHLIPLWRHSVANPLFCNHTHSGIEQPSVLQTSRTMRGHFCSFGSLIYSFVAILCQCSVYSLVQCLLQPSVSDALNETRCKPAILWSRCCICFTAYAGKQRIYLSREGGRADGSVVVVLQAGRSRVRDSMMWINFSFSLILPAALGSWALLSF